MSKPHKYTPEEIRFIRDNITGRGYAEMLNLFNRRFGLSITLMQMKGVISRRNISNGVDSRYKPGNISVNKGKKGIHPKTEFKPGHKPSNTKPVGAERMNDGYIEVKTGPAGEQRRAWKKKHRIIWEEANGKIPAGHTVIFADKNKLNLNLDNLLLISYGERSVMNHLGLIFNDAETTKAGKTIADLKLAVGGRIRGIKEQNKRMKQPPGRKDV